MSNKSTEWQVGQVGAALRKLVQLHAPPETSESLVLTAARLMETSFQCAPTLQTSESLTKGMLFRLVRARKHAESSKLANLTSSLKYQRGLSSDALWPILYVLNELSGTASEVPSNGYASTRLKQNVLQIQETANQSLMGTRTSGIGSGAVYDVDNHAFDDDNASFAPKPFAPSMERVTQSIESVPARSEEDESDLSESETRSTSRHALANNKDRPDRPPLHIRNKAIERELVRDLLLVVQGEDGTLLSFNEGEDDVPVKFNLPSGTDVPIAVRDMVQYISELGFLFRRVEKRIEEVQPDIHGKSPVQARESGQVSDNMYRGIAREMDAYYRSLMTLRGMEDLAVAQGEASECLSLRSVFVWADREKPRLRWLARLCEESRNLRGGQILAFLQKRRSSYVSDEIREMISRILASTAAPVNRMLLRWLAEGELYDGHGEFYVKEDSNVAATMTPSGLSGSVMMEESSVTKELAGVVNMASLASHRIWWGLFKLRKDMLPGSVNMDLAQKTLAAGKSVAFLRRCCSDSRWVDRVHAPLVASMAAGKKKLFEADYMFDSNVVRDIIEKAKDSACKRLKELFFDKFDLSHHFGAIRRYLLLSQGDFAQALMDGLAPILDGDGNILRSNLTGYVDGALQGCSSFNEETDQDILERLDVQIVVDDRPDLIGWDVFSLTYRVQDAPLNTVFSEKVMEAYLLIFRFLWKLKRLDHLMSQAYLNLRAESGVKGIDSREVIRRAHHLRMKMTHVLHNLQHYCTVEVLEGSWAVLEKEMSSADDLDGMIQAHAKYLTVIKDRTLLSDRSAYVASELDGVLDKILTFTRVQGEICEWAKRADGGEDSSDHDVGRELDNKLCEIEKKFDTGFQELLKALSKHTRMVETCVFLLFRLDFNRYYTLRAHLDEGDQNVE